MRRHIGIRHRVKRTTKNEARPTMMAILDEHGVRDFKLETETEEKDFLLGVLPIAWQGASPLDQVGACPVHHCKWRKLKKDENPEQFPSHHLRHEGKDVFLLTKVPSAYEGYREGDMVGMVLGGSGDRFAYALSRRGEAIGASVYRITPFALMALRQARGLTKAEKDIDHTLLAELVMFENHHFQLVTPRERELIALRQFFDERMDAMRERVKCDVRLARRMVGQVFLNPEGFYPEGRIEDLTDEKKASDVILQGMAKEEAARDRELAKAVAELEVYQRLLGEVEGVGPRIAAGIIAGIGEVRRFPTSAKLKAFCGVHVQRGGKYANVPPEHAFPRKRSGEASHWNEALVRQSLLRFGENFYLRPKSFWGQKFSYYKQTFRERHPEVVCKQCGVPWAECQTQSMHSRAYNDGHITRMAMWRTLTKFVEWLWKAWWELEVEHGATKPPRKANHPKDREHDCEQGGE